MPGDHLWLKAPPVTGVPVALIDGNGILWWTKDTEWSRDGGWFADLPAGSAKSSKQLQATRSPQAGRLVVRYGLNEGTGGFLAHSA
jgi:hypothetical protein